MVDLLFIYADQNKKTSRYQINFRCNSHSKKLFLFVDCYHPLLLFEKNGVKELIDKLNDVQVSVDEFFPHRDQNQVQWSMYAAERHFFEIIERAVLFDQHSNDVELMPGVATEVMEGITEKQMHSTQKK